uniref:Uncharacterized protein n=1 Tax=Pristionchus pacificus TaxID=54126 RepID=A0A2A6BYA8_PRIPA|eukprot:PDM70826.1 hypothetical protein PRIPAC_45030 [Pristionchus pacificus]
MEGDNPALTLRFYANLSHLPFPIEPRRQGISEAAPGSKTNQTQGERGLGSDTTLGSGIEPISRGHDAALRHSEEAGFGTYQRNNQEINQLVGDRTDHLKK